MAGVRSAEAASNPSARSPASARSEARIKPAPGVDPLDPAVQPASEPRACQGPGMLLTSALRHVIRNSPSPSRAWSYRNGQIHHVARHLVPVRPCAWSAARPSASRSRLPRRPTPCVLQGQCRSSPVRPGNRAAPRALCLAIWVTASASDHAGSSRSGSRPAIGRLRGAGGERAECSG